MAKKRVVKTVGRKGAKKSRAVKPRHAKSKSVGPSIAISEVIGKALIDKEFRELLFSDLDAALKGMRLSSKDKETLKRLDRKTVDVHAARLTGGRTAIAIAVGVSKSF